jgi:hypothetical protein
MMTFRKVRRVQMIVIFSVVLITGGIVSVISELRSKGEVEGVEDKRDSYQSTSDFNDIPVFKSEPPINGYVGEVYSYFVTISDSDSVDLELKLIKGPVWLRVEGLEVYGVPPRETDMNGEKVVLEVSDGVNSTYQTYYLNIIER